MNKSDNTQFNLRRFVVKSRSDVKKARHDAIQAGHEVLAFDKETRSLYKIEKPVS